MNVFARPNRLRENAEPAISRKGHGPARTNEEVLVPGIPVVEEEEETQMRPCAKTKESSTHIVTGRSRALLITID